MKIDFNKVGEKRYKMPGLSRYEFDEYGNCYSISEHPSNRYHGRKVEPQFTRKEPFYYLTADDGVRQKVYLREIRAFIMHIQQLRAPRIHTFEFRIPSKINNSITSKKEAK